MTVGVPSRALTLANSSLSACPHGRVVDTLVGAEHDRAPGPGAHAPEALR